MQENPHSNRLVFKIAQGEYRWVIAFIFLVALLTTLPYLLAASRQGNDWIFTGFVFGVEDGNSYIAKMLSGSSGAWLFRTPYTYLSQSGFLAYLPYIVLGKLAVPPFQHWQLVLLFHAFRIAAIFAYCLASYSFIAFFMPEIRLRRIGLILVALGGGFGWLITFTPLSHFVASLPRGSIAGLDIPLAFYSPEAFGFLMLYGLPHLAFGRAFLLWSMLALLSGTRWPNTEKFPGIKGGLIAGLLLICVGLMQPISVLVAWIVIAGYLAAILVKIRRLKSLFSSIYFKRSVWCVMVSSPLVIYNVLAFTTDPVLRGWSAQNVLLSPNPLYYLFAYGLFLPLVFVGSKKLISISSDSGLLPVAWVLIFPFLAYAPVVIQRRLTDGVWTAWVVLTLAAVSSFTSNTDLHTANKNRSWAQRYLQIVSFLSLVPAILLIVGGLVAGFQPDEPHFRTSEQVKAFNALKELAEPGEVVFTSYVTGNPLPAWAPVRVVLGHGPESVGFSEIYPQVIEIFQSTTPDRLREERFSDWNVQFVLWGPAERTLGDWDPRTASYLQQIAEIGSTTILYYRNGLQ